MSRTYGSPWRAPINQEELARQAAQGGEASRGEHQANVEAGLSEYYSDMAQKLDEGKLSPEEQREHDLIHRLNRLSQHENHEARWQRQHEAAIEVQAVHDKMSVLSRKLRAGQIDESVYYDRWTKLKIKEQELEKSL